MEMMQYGKFWKLPPQAEIKGTKKIPKNVEKIVENLGPITGKPKRISSRKIVISAV